MVEEVGAGGEDRVPSPRWSLTTPVVARPPAWLVVVAAGAALLAGAMLVGVPARWCLAVAASVTALLLFGPRGPVPDRPVAWNLFALASAMVAVGAVVGPSTGPVTIETPATVLGGLTLLGGAVALGRRRDEHSWGAALLDSVALGVSGGVVLWALVVLGTGDASSALLPSIGLTFDVAALAQVRFLNASRTAGARVLRLLSAGLLVGVALDVVDALTGAGLLHQPGAVAAVSAVPFILWSGAAVDPSRAGLGGGHAVPRAFNLRRVLIVVLATLVAPALGVVALQRGDLALLVPLVVVHMGMIGMVLARMYGLVARLRSQADRLAASVNTDRLTGLESDRRFTARLDALLASPDRQERYVLALSLSGISELNDTFGRTVADDVIALAASVIRREGGPGATAARTGAGTFAVLPPAGTDRQEVDALALRIRGVLDEPLPIRGMQVPAPVAVGIAELSEGCGDGAAVLHHCGHAVAAARESRTGVVWYGPSIAEGAELAAELISELGDAIAAGQLVVHFQPQLDLVTGRVVGAEALVRWAHPTRGLLPPMAFVPAAERSGAIRLLTLVVLDRAIAQCAAWDEDGRHVTVAVNLSARNLLDPALVDDVRMLLATYRLPAGRLELEITETLAMLDPVRSGEVLQSLADLGVTLSVDDYGTGYGSLAYLQRLPVSRLKIDRSFVGEIVTDPVSAAIVRSTIDLAQQVGLEVVAEGVEDLETLGALRAMGCHVAQGFVLGRAVPGSAAQAQWKEIEDRINEPTVPTPRHG